MAISTLKAFAVAAAMLASFSFALMKLEGLSPIDSFYLSTMTFTTVGYGDIPAPVSIYGKIITICAALFGVGYFGNVVLPQAQKIRENLDGRLAIGSPGIAAFTINTLIGVALCYYLKDDGGLPPVNPGDFDSFVEAAYFSVITLSSVGYGDYHPKSDEGKILVSIFAIFAMNSLGVTIDACSDFIKPLCEEDKEKES